MSIASNAGASTAAQEILVLVEQKIAENTGRPEIVAVLREIEEKAKRIKASADMGWY